MDRFGWDDPLPDEVLNQWQKIITGLNSLNHVKVPRCYFYTNQTVVCSQLYGFSDASDQAFAAVIYIRSTYNDGTVEVRIVGSKTRVAPTKKPSIPRLELLGALILPRLVNTISRSLSQELPYSTGLIQQLPYTGFAILNNGNYTSITVLLKYEEYLLKQLGDTVQAHLIQPIFLHEALAQRNCLLVSYGGMDLVFCN